MADELDKFVLQYSVEMKDAITRLEQLNQKIEKTGKASGKVSGEIKDFASGAADEIGKIVPGIDKVSAAIKMMGAEFAVAGLAVGALAVGVKSVMDMRDQYNQQRKEGMDIGVSELRMEEYQRKFAKASGGNITREQTAENLKKLSEFSSAVFRDPTRTGTEARTARVLGINMGAPGQHVSTNALIQQLGEKFAKMTDAQVQAQAKIIGLNQDFALGLKKQGGSVGQITELSRDEILHRKSAQDSLVDFNDAMSRLSENFRKAGNVLGEELIQPLTKFVQLMVDLTNSLPKNVPAIKSAATETATIMLPGYDAAKGMYSIFEWAKDKITGKPQEVPKVNATEQASTKAMPKKGDENAKSLKEMIDGNFEANEEAKRIADQEALAINQFAGAVASFANAVDEKQAWAAWAGEVGKAAGLVVDKKPNLTHPVEANTASQAVAEPSSASNAPAITGAAINKTEGKPTGLVAEKIGASNRPQNKTAETVIRAGESDEPSKAGESRSKIQLKMVQQTIAQRLGVPVQQLQLGGVNRGDVRWATKQTEAGIQNNIYDLNNQLRAVNLPQQARSKIVNEVRAQQSGLAMMRQYSSQISDKAREGDRSITIGERAIIINVNGTLNPVATAAQIQSTISEHLGEIVNGTSTGMKY